MARTKYVAFGGARGGGKSWSVREKAKRLAIKWGGIKILIIRKTYTDLRENHILPLKADLAGFAVYKEQDKAFFFPNGSRIKCSYFANDADALQYQGQEYDVIFLEEATQFTELVFNVLKACLRGANPFPKRMYLTCNPDGVGFLWVKRLFVARDYLPEEKPDEYMFIQSLVDDNQILVRSNPDYVEQLDSLPEEMRKRWRYGSWDVAEGQYFGEFRRDKHVCAPFAIPPEWRRYIAIDYGLDMLAAYWIAVSPARRCYVYKELCQSNLPIGRAAEAILNFTEKGERIHSVLAPPDLWGRSQETGKSRAILFYEAGLTLTKSNNDREAGWLAIKEMLAYEKDNPSVALAGDTSLYTREADSRMSSLREHADVRFAAIAGRLSLQGNRTGGKEPQLQIFSNCEKLIKHLPELQRNPKKPNDTLTEPHEITHSPDALRYFAIYWTSPEGEGAMPRVRYRADHLQDWRNGSEEVRRLLIKKYGGMPLL